MDPFLDNFRAAYNLCGEIATDESMIGFKERLYFIQYMPKQPTKWGMKAFVQRAVVATPTPGVVRK